MAAYCAIGHDIWIGNADYCDLKGSQFDLVIHVHHEASPTPGRCKAFDKLPDSKGFFVRYIDCESLDRATLLSVPTDQQKRRQIEQIAVYASQPGRLLCHCAAGMCRGPTMAAIAKVARGCTFPQAMHDIYQGLWAGYYTCPNFARVPLTEIARWAWDGAKR